MIIKENKEIYGVIYLIRNNINNKIYIGQTTETFDKRYRNDIANNTHNKHLKRSIEKYGIENFYIDKEFDVAYSREELDKLEDMYIKMYETTNSNKGYNKKFGGSNGKHTEESLNKMRECKIGEKNPCYGRVGEIHHMYGKTHTEETKKKISQAIKGENNPFYGKVHTEETKKKISQAISGENHPFYRMKRIEHSKRMKGENNPFYGKTHSEEIKKKLSEINKGKFVGEKSPRAKSVICITTGKIFTTLKEAGVFYNCNNNHISSCCRGKRNYCGKLEDGTRLKWAYYEDYITQQKAGEPIAS